MIIIRYYLKLQLNIKIVFMITYLICNKLYDTHCKINVNKECIVHCSYKIWTNGPGGLKSNCNVCLGLN